MRKTLLICCIALVTQIFASAQVQLGGTLSFSYEKDPTVISYNVSPEVGFSVNPRWVLGMQLSCFHEEERSSSVETTGFAISPFARFSVVNLGPLVFFTEGRMRFRGTKVEDSSLNTESRDNTFDIAVRPGLSFPVNDHLEFMTHLGALNYNFSDKDLALRLDVSSVDLGFVFKF